MLPSHELKFIFQFLLPYIFHFIEGLILFGYFDVNIFDLFLGLVVYSLNLFFVVVNCFILLFLIPLLKGLNLVLEFHQFLRVLSVCSRVLEDDFLSVFNLLFVPVLELVNLSVSVLEKVMVNWTIDVTYKF